MFLHALIDYLINIEITFQSVFNKSFLSGPDCACINMLKIILDICINFYLCTGTFNKNVEYSILKDVVYSQRSDNLNIFLIYILNECKRTYEQLQ